MFPAFTNAALLAGLAAVTAPILIHLLLRRRSQRLRFSTVQFFVKRDEQSMRKRKLRNWFLLAVRVTLFALIVLAFARPFLPRATAASGSHREQAVIILDRSASMQAQAAGGPFWPRAKALARRIVGNLRPEDRAALILCPGSEPPQFSAPAVLARQLETISPGFSAGDLNEGVRQAAKLLALTPPGYRTTVHIISDLQRNSALNPADASLPKDVQVEIADPGDRFAPNVAVTDFRLEGLKGPHAVVTSFSDETCSALPWELRVDGRAVSSGELHLDQGASTNVPLSIPSLSAGWHSASFVIRPGDAFSADDTAYATVRIPQPLRAVVVEPHPKEKIWEETSYFVASALNPGGSSGEMSASRFTFEKSGAGTLAQALSPRSQIAFVAVPGIKEIPSATAEALKAFVQNGGGVLLFAGPEVSANEYNSKLSELLPAELGRIEATGNGDAAWRIASFSRTSPVFAPFRERSSGNLAIPEFTHRFTLSVTSNATVLAEFDDGVPAVVERRFGKGHAVLVNTTADTEWTDWQKHKTFVPWLHAAALFLSGEAGRETPGGGMAFNTGAETDLNPGVKKQAVNLVLPDKSIRSLVTDEEGRLVDPPLEWPGIYKIETSQNTELLRFAVNMPPAESDLTFMPPAELQQQIVRSAPQANRTLTAGLFGDADQGKELWRVLLLAALAFLIFEPLLANKTAA